MDREILFRGISKETKAMVYGAHFTLHHDDQRTHIHHFIIPENTPIPKEKPIGEIQIEVDPATVGQFTGVYDGTKWEELSQQEKDRWLKKHSVKEWNGRRIFEGDIVKTHYANAVKSDFVETVVFHNGRFCANSNISETGQWWTSLADGVPHVSFDKSVYMESCKVIGNIHDNPELLKEVTE